MNGLTILSPHPDDAAFSLAIALERWRTIPLEVLVVNFFTRSEYAPRAILSSADNQDRSTAISALRAREDRRALAKLNPQIKIKDCSLLDAPLRHRTNLEGVFNADLARVAETEVASLARTIGPYVRRSLVLCPLGLGNHVDHLSVKMAALSLPLGKRLGFYEDAPYVRWISKERILQLVSACGSPLRAHFVPTYLTWRHKRRIVGEYQTQIDEAEAVAIARFSARTKSGERIWIPAHSRAWSHFLRK